MTTKLVSREELPTKLYVDNEFKEGTGATIKLVNPKDASTIAEFKGASEADVDNAVSSSQKAFESGSWTTLSGEQKGVILNKFAQLILDNASEIAYLESICSGRPLAQCNYEIPRIASVYRYYAGWADKIKGDSYPPEDGFYKIVRQEPLGVCAGITAWNGSLHFLGFKSAPALACGNTVIIKPSEKSPLGTLAVASLIKEAGFPPGVFQVLPGGGDVGAMLSSHMKIAKISFTGSTFTGRKIQDAATKSNLKRVTLELGGKSPALVFDDASLEKAVFWCTIGIATNAGQVCAATTRLFVQEGIADKFLAALKGSFEAITKTLGSDPQEMTTTYGPLVDKIQYDKVRGFIEEGKKSTEVILGGEEYTKGGYYIGPVIFKNPTDEAKIYREEIFGPVLCVRTFKTEEEAIQLANDTDYGLAGAIYTQDVNRALRVPMGGFGSSGYGRELGEYAIRHYTETKAIWIK
ncbi:aldehyde dehydrogenase [Lophium mytilinum]|uniref:aldehyde dehydrogenase (NAD(+)) n=1 Tax=Lophium mytilinum TaxID=390894 RepID=A0A6A6R6K9_9PEZI|nr:aldehyde dehydrogenase [Lophium mytilinum]